MSPSSPRQLAPRNSSLSSRHHLVLPQPRRGDAALPAPLVGAFPARPRLCGRAANQSDGGGKAPSRRRRRLEGDGAITAPPRWRRPLRSVNLPAPPGGEPAGSDLTAFRPSCLSGLNVLALRKEEKRRKEGRKKTQLRRPGGVRRVSGREGVACPLPRRAPGPPPPPPPLAAWIWLCPLLVLLLQCPRC